VVAVEAHKTAGRRGIDPPRRLPRQARRPAPTRQAALDPRIT
jgi:hypothetical protein